MKTTTTKRTAAPSMIHSATLARVTDKATGAFLGYLVRSDSEANTWHFLTWDDEALCWRCPCRSTIPCKHVRAVESLCQARVELGRGPCYATSVQPTTQRRTARLASCGDIVEATAATIEAHAAILSTFASSAPVKALPAAPRRQDERERRETAPLRGTSRAFSLF